MSVQPGTKAKVTVPKAQITYMAKNSIYTYEQMVTLIHIILADVGSVIKYLKEQAN